MTYRFAESLVFYGPIPLANTCPEDFVILSDIYGKDEEQVFCGFRKIEPALTSTFTSLAGKYAKDVAKVYYLGREIHGVDATSFEFIGTDEYDYAQDDFHIYSLGQKQAYDRTSFQRLPGWYARDQYSLFYHNKNIEGDPLHIVILNQYYAQTKESVYFKSHKIHRVDLKTFTLLQYPYSKDFKHVYYEHRRVKGRPQSFITL